MKIIIIGATGFIGKALVNELEEGGHEVYAVTRNPQKARNSFSKATNILHWDSYNIQLLSQLISGKDVVVNLSGENLAAGRWTARRRKIITDSRVRTSQLLAEAIRLSDIKPSALIQGSAIGIYGFPVNSAPDESHPAGKGFIADLAKNWETAVLPVADLIERVVFVRTGLVLGRNEGLLKQIMLPFKFGIGITPGNGNQIMSWIHISDHVKAMRFLIENKTSSGPYNLTSTNPVTMSGFIKAAGKITKTRTFLKVAPFFISAILGKMGKETVLSSQNIYPAKLESEGFSFLYSDLDTALSAILSAKDINQ